MNNEIKEGLKMLSLLRITEGPLNHFFGYYDKSPWNKSGEFILSLATTVYNHQPEPDDTAKVGIIQVEDGNWIEISSTKAWNWQQGSMLQWYPEDPEDIIIFNDREKDSFIARIFDVRSLKEVHRLPFPIYAVDPKARYALSLNFARLHRTRPGYGYAGVKDKWEKELHPAEDGIYRIDLKTGEYKLIISIEQLYLMDTEETMKGVEHWVNHIQIPPSGERFAFLHRWRKSDGGFWTRLITANPDGSGIKILSKGVVSHYDWKDDSHILAWTKFQEEYGFFLIEDKTGRYTQIGKEKLTQDGHCSYSPDRTIILTDTYPDFKNLRTLILYKEASNERIDLARFYSPPELAGPVRCDLHPRWSRDGRYICIDSAHEGDRQMYIIDLKGFIK